ncbi:hypothetical protein EDB83DRAFT_2182058, partial [Lactarius deliciosus]
RSYLQVTQPMEYKVVRNWGDRRRLWNYTPTEERPTDPMRRRMHQVKNVNIAIRTMLTPYTQSQATSAVVSASDDDTDTTPAYNGFAMSHRMRGIDMARQD